MSEPPQPRARSAFARDRALRRIRVVSWAVGAVTAGLAGALSVVAAHAFRGHDRSAPVTPTSAVGASRQPTRRVHVPPPQHVPSIDEQAPLQPPSSPPAAAPPTSPSRAPASPAPAPEPAPAPVPAPQTSGGS